MGGADLSPGSLPEHDESYLKSVFGPPADTDYDYYEAEVPNAVPQRVPDPLLRQNTSGPTRVPHNSSSPPNFSGAPQFGSNVTAAGDFGRKVEEPGWLSAWWYPTWARDPVISEFYQTSMIYLWVEYHQSVGVALCLLILSTVYTALAACCRRGGRTDPSEPLPTAPPASFMGQTLPQAARGGTNVSFEYFPPNCPRCGRSMNIRHVQSGASSGHAFWGCPMYKFGPGLEACSGTRDAKVWVITRFE